MRWIDSFLDYLQFERRYSEKTILSYGADLRQFEAFVEEGIGRFDPVEVSSENVRDWIVSLMDRGYTASTVNRMLSSLRSFFKYLARQEVITADPMQKVQGLKKRKVLPSFLKESEMNRLLDDTDFGSDFEGYRDHLIILMFYATGMRLSELIGLNDADVDFSSGLIKVTGKRNKQRLIPFDKELAEAVTSYMQQRNEAIPECSDALFVTKKGSRMSGNAVYRLVRKNLSKVVTNKKRSPHVLRHTFATTMLNHDADLGAIKELLGHENLATTEIYTHTTFEELKKVYNQAHPRA
jgi:integrase/recombinase XerC